MILLCTSNRSDVLGEAQRGRAVALGVEYPLSIGRRYWVAGMLIWETTLSLIINGDDGAPTTAPAGFFEQVPVEVPGDWSFVIGPGVGMSGSRLWENPLVAMWGYPELIEDRGHLDALLDGDSDACAVFYRRMEAESSAK
jgi:hypothetical protein